MEKQAGRAAERSPGVGAGWVGARRTLLPTDRPPPNKAASACDTILSFSSAFGPRECPNLAGLV